MEKPGIKYCGMRRRSCENHGGGGGGRLGGEELESGGEKGRKSHEVRLQCWNNLVFIAPL